MSITIGITIFLFGFFTGYLLAALMAISKEDNNDRDNYKQ